MRRLSIRRLLLPVAVLRLLPVRLLTVTLLLAVPAARKIASEREAPYFFS